MQTTIKIDLQKIADEIGNLEMYWDYRDELTEKQIIKIIREENGLMDVENEIWENCWEVIAQDVNYAIDEYMKENNIELDDSERDELRTLVEENYTFDIKGLLNNSSARIRVMFHPNEDMVDTSEGMKNHTVMEFRRRFKNKFKISDLQREIDNCPSYGNFTFYFKVSGTDILTLRDAVQSGWLDLQRGQYFGLFDSWNGGGSLLDMQLTGNVKIFLKDWRIKSDKDLVMKRISGENTSSYYGVSIKADSEKYGIQDVYGLTGEAWRDW